MFMSFSKYAGDAVIRGTKCEKWVYFSKSYNSTIYVEKANTSVPVLIEGTMSEFNFAYTIVKYKSNVVFAKDEFELPKSCKSKGVFSVV